jgi:Ca2+-binding RTX toxin-like protein
MAQVVSVYHMLEDEINYTLPDYNLEDILGNLDSLENPIFLPLAVIGNGKANNIVGNAEVNLINGGAGQDVMTGGAGSDTYIVDDAGDVIVELANGGLENVNASVSYTLSANVENLILTGTGDAEPGMYTDNIDGTGNDLDNILQGNAGNNRLTGGNGNDNLGGGMGGVDTLDGGNGNDTYFINGVNDVVIEGANGGFDTVWINVDNFDVSKFKNIEVVKYTKDLNDLGSSQDYFILDDKLSAKSKGMKIANFDVKSDTVCLSKAVFSKIAKKGDLAGSAFWTGAKAHDKNDRIVYDKKAGALYYDADGNGAGKAVKFATIHNKLKMTADDFFVM